MIVNYRTKVDVPINNTLSSQSKFSGAPRPPTLDKDASMTSVTNLSDVDQQYSLQSQNISHEHQSNDFIEPYIDNHNKENMIASGHTHNIRPIEQVSDNESFASYPLDPVKVKADSLLALRDQHYHMSSSDNDFKYIHKSPAYDLLYRNSRQVHQQTHAQSLKQQSDPDSQDIYSHSSQSMDDSLYPLSSDNNQNSFSESIHIHSSHAIDPLPQAHPTQPLHNLHHSSHAIVTTDIANDRRLELARYKHTLDRIKERVAHIASLPAHLRSESDRAYVKLAKVAVKTGNLEYC